MTAAPDSPGESIGDLEEMLSGLLRAVLVAEGAPADAIAEIHLVDREEMAALNAEHMGATGPTDVLSFPLDGRGDPDPGEPRGPGDHIVGDVVICADVAAAQAAEHAGTLVDECRLLTVHGALHLCGWDHGDDQERAAMWARERELMESLGVPPSLDPWQGSGAS